MADVGAGRETWRGALLLHLCRQLISLRPILSGFRRAGIGCRARCRTLHGGHDQLALASDTLYGVFIIGRAARWTHSHGYCLRPFERQIAMYMAFRQP